MQDHTPHSRALPTAFILIAIGTAIGFLYKKWLPPVATEHGVAIDRVISYIFLTTGLIFLAGHFILAWLVRKATGPNAGGYRPESSGLQWAWASVPLLLFTIVSEVGVLAMGSSIWVQLYGPTAKVNPWFQVIALRYFNPAGAHDSGLIGEYPLSPPNNLVPVITQTAAGKRNSLTVYGSNYATPDGTCIRDYIHVVDIAKAHVVALERLLQQKNKKNYEVFNLGTGKGNTGLEAIHAFEKVTGTKVNYGIGPRREGDVEKVWADTTLANKELGWKSELSLDDIMSSAWK